MKNIKCELEHDNIVNETLYRKWKAIKNKGKPKNAAFKNSFLVKKLDRKKKCKHKRKQCKQNKHKTNEEYFLLPNCHVRKTNNNFKNPIHIEIVKTIPKYVFPNKLTWMEWLQFKRKDNQPCNKYNKKHILCTDDILKPF